MPDVVSSTSEPALPGVCVLARRGDGLGAGRFEVRFTDQALEDDRIDLLLGRPDGSDRSRLVAWARALATVSHPSLPPILRIELEKPSFCKNDLKQS